MNEFKLKAPYKPTGDQPQAIAELVKGFKEGNQCQTLLGVTGSGKTFTMANVIQQLQKPTLVIAHNKTLAAQLYGEFKEMFPITQWNILSPTTIITSRKLMFHQTHTLPRTLPSTMRSTSSATLRQQRFLSGMMSSLWQVCPAFTDWVRRLITRRW